MDETRSNFAYAQTHTPKATDEADNGIFNGVHLVKFQENGFESLKCSFLLCSFFFCATGMFPASA